MNRQKSFENERPTLYLVATPIGNLDEMTYRSINTLKNVKITNIKFTKKPGIGNGNIYYKNVNNFAKCKIYCCRRYKKYC